MIKKNIDFVFLFSNKNSIVWKISKFAFKLLLSFFQKLTSLISLFLKNFFYFANKLFKWYSFFFSFNVKSQSLRYSKKLMQRIYFNVCNPSSGNFVAPCPQGYGIRRNCIMCTRCHIYFVDSRGNLVGCISSYQSPSYAEIFLKITFLFLLSKIKIFV